MCTSSKLSESGKLIFVEHRFGLLVGMKKIVADVDVLNNQSKLSPYFTTFSYFLSPWSQFFLLDFLFSLLNFLLIFLLSTFNYFLFLLCLTLDFPYVPQICHEQGEIHNKYHLKMYLMSAPKCKISSCQNIYWNDTVWYTISNDTHGQNSFSTRQYHLPWWASRILYCYTL